MSSLIRHLSTELGAASLASISMQGYVDVHCHLTDTVFKSNIEEVISKSARNGLEYIVVNGLEPKSNRDVLHLCNRYKMLLPAIGIYPLNACANYINDNNWTHDFVKPESFDVDAEIDFIDAMAQQGKIVAIGECGLDRHYLKVRFIYCIISTISDICS